MKAGKLAIRAKSSPSPTQIQPKSQLLFHKNLLPWDFSTVTLKAARASRPHILVVFALWIILSCSTTTKQIKYADELDKGKSFQQLCNAE